MATAPILTYTMSYTIWDPITNVETTVPLELGGTVKRSFSEHFNTINVTYNSNISLNRYEVRATEIPEYQDPLLQRQSWGVREGVLLYENYGSIAANTNHSYQIVIDSTKFSIDKQYRIGLYARSAVDNTWDATQLFITSDGILFVKPDGTWFETLVQDSVNWEYPQSANNNLSITQAFRITQNGTELELE